jgi:hypothetical protein
MTEEDAEGHAHAATAAELDERLKAVLEPQAAVVERVVRGALVDSRRTAARRWSARRLVPIAAGVALAAAALLVAFRQAARVPPAPSGMPRQAIEIRNGGGLVTARSPSGRLWVVGGGGRPPHPSPGSIILVHRSVNR